MCPPFSLTCDADQIALRLIATTDVHVHIHPHDYYADRPAPGTGLAHAAATIARLRDAAPNSLLLDNGDILQGNPMGDYVAEVRGLSPDAPHPAIAAMNTLGYDAATLGNHEFNYGLDFLMRALSAARFPVTSANVLMAPAADPAQDATLLPPFLILPRLFRDGAGRAQSVNIGVIGILPPQIMTWDGAHLRGHVTTRDSLLAVRSRLPQMRAAGADIIVALSHSGIGPGKATPEMENVATVLAALPGIDALVAGHSHLVFPSDRFPGPPEADARQGRLNGTPAVMPGYHASHLGVIDMVLQKGHPSWQVAQARSHALPLPQPGAGAPHPLTAAVLRATQDDHNATLAHVRRTVGETEVPLNTYFAALPGNAALALVAQAQAWHVARALEDGPHAHLPLLSASAPFKMGGRGGVGNYTDVPPGPIALRHVADLYPYPNRIAAVLVTGAELRDWLERATGIFRTITPGEADQPLLNAAEPSSQFDVISGVTWEIDLSRPAQHPAGSPGHAAAPGRIRNLRFRGAPVTAGQRFVLATNSHRAGGADSFPGTGPSALLYQSDALSRDVLLAYLRHAGPVRAPGPGPWRFAPLPGTSVLYDTAPAARAHRAALAPLRIDEAGTAPGGLARFRVHL